MNSRIHQIGVFLIILSICSGISAKPHTPNRVGTGRQETKKPFAFEDIIPNNGFGAAGFNGAWISNNQFTHIEDRVLKRFNAELENNEDIIAFTELDPTWGSSPSLQLSADGLNVLVRFNVKSIFRHSTVANYAVLNLASKISNDIADKKDISICRWTPTGNGLVYVIDNDIYYRNIITGTEHRLTDDGVPGIIYNGVPDWVYEEEVFSSDGALWVSPDSKLIAFARFNDTEVESFSYPIYGEPGNPEYQYPGEVTIKYPKAGTNNPEVELKVIDIDAFINGNIDAIYTIPAPIDVVTDDHILGSVTWINDSTVAPTWLNRRQNMGVLQGCQFPNVQECEKLYEFSQLDGWIDVATPICPKDSGLCFLENYDSGWRRIMKLDLSSKSAIYVTEELYWVLGIYGYNAQTDKLYYLSTLPGYPEQRHVFENNVCLTCDVSTPENNKCTYASASFSRDFSYYSLTCSGPDPSTTKIHLTSTRAAVRTWVDNQNLRNKLMDYQKTNIIFKNVTVGTDFQASVKCAYPAGLDIENGNTKHPLLIYVYAGPNSVRVTSNFGIGIQDYFVSSRKMIYCQIDGRGSGNKGTDLLFTINNKLGTFEMEDQIAVVKSLERMFPTIDADRVGIYGSSYGGYATAMTLVKDKERVFQCGVSMAPVTSWIYYDTIYTERYMGTPQDNTESYRSSDVSRYVEEFRTHDFMLIHGTADDNVHYQQSMSLLRRLEEENVVFEQMAYPDEAHSLSGVQKHLYHTIDNFWVECLNLEVEEE